MSQFGHQHTGYCNIDILDNEDLFPDEGYEFKPNRTKRTTNYGNSIEFPLNTSINSTCHVQVAPEIRPPTPISDPPMPKVTAHRRKLIQESTLRTRAAQVEYNQKRREYEREIKAYEGAESDMQITKVRDEVARSQETKRKQTRLLEDVYKQQLQQKAARLQHEKKEEQDYEAQLIEEDRLLAIEDEKKRQRQREIALERRAEFEAKNAELQRAKAEKHKRELQEEKLLQAQSAELAKRQEERQAEDERRRLEKTRMRSCVVDQQTKALAAHKAKQDNFEMKCESQAAKQAELELQQQEEKKKRMAEERHSEWIRLQKEQQARRSVNAKRPYPLVKQEVDREALAKQKAREQAIELRLYQEKQAQDRRNREKAELEADRELEKKNLELTQKQFDAELARLQELVPPEMGITVPRYVVKNTFSK